MGDDLRFDLKEVDTWTRPETKVLEKAPLPLPGSITKSGKPRTVHLNRDALNVLLQLRERDPNSKTVFPKTRDGGFSLNYVSTVISEACDQIGVPDATMHATRHTFNTRLIEKTTSPMAVKELMGHSSLEMTDYYTHLSRETLKEAVKKLEKQPEDSVSVPE